MLVHICVATQICTILLCGYFVDSGNNIDFNSTTQTITITAGTNSTIIKIWVKNDNIIEGDEMFTMNFNVPSSLDPGIMDGAITMATAFIIDTSSMLHSYNVIVLYLISFLDIKVRFTKSLFSGSEALGSVVVSIELRKGTSASSFNVSIIPSAVSAQGKESNAHYLCVY